MWLRYLELFANAVPPDVVRTRQQHFNFVPRLTQHAIARIAQKLTHGTSLVAVIDGENANIPGDQVIMTCVAMGFPDEDFVANHVQSRRAPGDAVASFVGFE